MAGITKNTPNPYGGTYDRNDKGELNGRVTDLAMPTIDKAGGACHLHGRSEAEASPGWSGLHLPEICPVWPDHRSP